MRTYRIMIIMSTDIVMIILIVILTKLEEYLIKVPDNAVEVSINISGIIRRDAFLRNRVL